MEDGILYTYVVWLLAVMSTKRGTECSSMDFETSGKPMSVLQVKLGVRYKEHKDDKAREEKFKATGKATRLLSGSISSDNDNS